LGAGSVYLLLHLLGNHLVAFGLRVRFVAPLLVAPLALLWLAWRKRRLAARRTRDALTLSFLHVAAAVGFAVLFSMRAGHISAFHPKYSITVVPAAAVLLAVGLDRALARPRTERPVWIGVAGLQVVVLAVSLSSAYLCTEVLPPWPPQRQVNPYRDIAAAVEASEPEGETTVECPRLVDAKIIHVLLQGRGDPRYKIKSPSAEDTVVIHRGGQVVGRYSLAELRY
jgi:hypothetical protein